MCGIVGIVFSDRTRHVSKRVLDPALAVLQHRGPNGEGRLVLPGIAAGMRRLAIIDVDGGDQPIFNETNDIGVLFNGEIYNYRELRDLCESRGHSFRTASDTETIVHLYEEFGDQFVEQLDGMFAFVVWDIRRKRALLARDRFGIKPLYTTSTKDGFAFASEVKALVALGLTRPLLTETRLGDYLRLLWIPEPDTAWEGVTRLPPGTSLVVESGLPSSPLRYYSPNLRPQIGVSDKDACAQIESLLANAVRRQLVADVPLGAFLSGGLDSSLLVSHAVRLGRHFPVHTMRISRNDQRLDPIDDDALFATQLSAQLQLEQHIHELQANLVDLLPRLLWFTDDPVADPAIINAYLICRASGATTRVLLSGMGADEINGGYRRHLAADVLRPFFWAPSFARSAAIGAIRGIGSLVPATPTVPLLRRITKMASAIPMDVHRLPMNLAAWVSEPWIERLGISASSHEDVRHTVESRCTAEFDDPLGATMAFDLSLYLPSHNLHYVDKMSMACSVEVRVPFLDNALAEYVLSLPYRLRVCRQTTKVALRASARSLLPSSIIKRSKTGFAAPIRSWLSGPLREMSHDLLSVDVTRRRGLVDPRTVTAMLKAYDNSAEDLAYGLWALLTLELWCQVHMDTPAVAAAGAVSSWPSVPSSSHAS